VVRGVFVSLSPFGNMRPGVKDVSYEITRKRDGAHGEHTYDFLAQTPLGEMPGALVVDADGRPVSVVYRASYGEFIIERSSPPR
jgi:hypothetical protein